MRSLTLLNSALTAATFLASPVFAEQTKVVMPSSLTPDALWKKVGDFCGIAGWHPIVSTCELTANGRLRTLTVKGGDTLTAAVKQWDRGRGETHSSNGIAVDALEQWDDVKRCYAYTLVYGEAPFTDYHSTLCVTDHPQGSALAWSGNYRLKPGVTAKAAAKFLQDVYTTGAQALTQNHGVTK